ncbi:MAG: response regulator [Candidatus Omnitrophica bacterium]|nr:response regulator [Candidatus Omnitrophota bacterium]
MKRTVVVIDDFDEMTDAVADVLESDKFDVVCFSEARAALDYINENKVEVVITDVRMPEIDGTEVIRRLKETDPLIQVIIMTAYPSVYLIIQMLEAGAVDFLIKPFDVEILQRAVEQALDRFQRWEHLKIEYVKQKKKKLNDRRAS